MFSQHSIWAFSSELSSNLVLFSTFYPNLACKHYCFQPETKTFRELWVVKQKMVLFWLTLRCYVLDSVCFYSWSKRIKFCLRGCLFNVSIATLRDPEKVASRKREKWAELLRVGSSGDNTRLTVDENYITHSSEEYEMTVIEMHAKNMTELKTVCLMHLTKWMSSSNYLFRCNPKVVQDLSANGSPWTGFDFRLRFQLMEKENNIIQIQLAGTNWYIVL